jgi:hypothetical protein
MNPLRQQIAAQAYSLGNQQPVRNGFNPYSAGSKRYGPSQRRGPNAGMALDQSGYNERDQRARMQRQVMLERLQAMQRGNFNSPAANRAGGR